MKVPSRLSSRRRNRPLKIVFISVVMLLMAMFLPAVASAVSSFLMTPFHAVNRWLAESSSLVPTFIRDRKDLNEQIKTLQNDLVVAGRTNLTEQRLLEENNRLRQLLGISSEERIAAGIIARPNEIPYDMLQIDKGSDDGVEVGAPVFIGRDVVIGLVTHVSSVYSFIQLITTPGFSASAFISGPNIVVDLEGMGGGMARVKVPQGVPLMVGNLVYLPSVEPGVFGRISYVENRPTQPEQYGYVSPDIPISGLYQVAVGKRSQISRSVTEVDERVLEEMRSLLFLEELNKRPTTTMEVSSTSTDSYD